MSQQRNARVARPAAAGTDRDLAARSTAVDHYLELLRRCVSDCGWTLDALATEMGLDKGFLWKLLHGEKPWRIEHLLALPDDVEQLFEQRRAEGFGLIVVPPVSDEQAVRNLVSGLVGVLSAKLPGKADRLAKAALLPADREAAS